MTYSVKLQNFEGPLDLLLHLVSKSKVKIEDISIAEITEQYLDYLEKMRKFDIEIASEFLVMAATLIYIKSQMLLPKPVELADEEDSDPKKDLILKLAEYKKYKKISDYLRQREKIYSCIYYKLPEEIISSEKAGDNVLDGVTSEQLLKALLKLLKKKHILNEEKKIAHEVKKNSISVSQRIKQLEFLFWEKDRWKFDELFNDQHTKTDIIVTFLAILEMLKTNDVEVYQQNPFDDIIIKRRDIGNG